MSGEKFDTVQSGTPAAMDEETYQSFQELFQLARAGVTEQLEKFFEARLVPNLLK